MVLRYKDIDIRYEVTGNGKTLVLLHGFLESIEMWDTITKLFRETHQIIRIDLLGHGQTGCLGYVHTMDDMAEAVLAVLTKEKISKAHVVGHSMGGYVALAMAETKPDIFNGLCLMNSTFDADNNARKEMRRRAINMAKTNYSALVKMSFSNLFAPQSRIAHKVAFEAALKLAQKTTVQGYIAAQEGMMLRPCRFDILKHLKCHKLIITGKKDSLINSETLVSKLQYTHIDHVEFSMGHMSHIENISDLSYYLKRFIEK